jgi:hypothetical protein
MDYTIRVLRKCKEHGFKVYMDPHQDIVSAYSTPCNVLYLTVETLPSWPVPIISPAVSARSAPLPECPTWFLNM